MQPCLAHAGIFDSPARRGDGHGQRCPVQAAKADELRFVSGFR